MRRDETSCCAESSLRRVLSVASGLPCYPDAETLPRRDETHFLNKYERRVSFFCSVSQSLIPWIVGDTCPDDTTKHVQQNFRRVVGNFGMIRADKGGTGQERRQDRTRDRTRRERQDERQDRMRDRERKTRREIERARQRERIAEIPAFVSELSTDTESLIDLQTTVRVWVSDETDDLLWVECSSVKLSKLIVW